MSRRKSRGRKRSRGRSRGKRYPKLTKTQKACASDFIAEEFRYGGSRSRAQKIAIGLSRARRECR